MGLTGALGLGLWDWDWDWDCLLGLGLGLGLICALCCHGYCLLFLVLSFLGSSVPGGQRARGWPPARWFGGTRCRRVHGRPCPMQDAPAALPAVRPVLLPVLPAAGRGFPRTSFFQRAPYCHPTPKRRGFASEAAHEMQSLLKMESQDRKTVQA